MFCSTLVQFTPFKVKIAKITREEWLNEAEQLYLI